MGIKGLLQLFQPISTKVTISTQSQQHATILPHYSRLGIDMLCLMHQGLTATTTIANGKGDLNKILHGMNQYVLRLLCQITQCYQTQYNNNNNQSNIHTINNIPCNDISSTHITTNSNHSPMHPSVLHPTHVITTNEPQIKLICVFDGLDLPLKQFENEKRAQMRKKYQDFISGVKIHQQNRLNNTQQSNSKQYRIDDTTSTSNTTISNKDINKIHQNKQQYDHVFNDEHKEQLNINDLMNYNPFLSILQQENNNTTTTTSLHNNQYNNLTHQQQLSPSNSNESNLNQFTSINSISPQQLSRSIALGHEISATNIYILIQLIQEHPLLKNYTECIVAPYQADSQLAFLCKIGYINAVYSEDSDLLVYGSPKTLFKLEKQTIVSAQNITNDSHSNNHNTSMKNGANSTTHSTTNSKNSKVPSHVTNNSTNTTKTVNSYSFTFDEFMLKNICECPCTLTNSTSDKLINNYFNIDLVTQYQQLTNPNLNQHQVSNNNNNSSSTTRFNSNKSSSTTQPNYTLPSFIYPTLILPNNTILHFPYHNWSSYDFIIYSILLGCDFIPNLPRCGPKTVTKMILAEKLHRTQLKLLNDIQQLRQSQSNRSNNLKNNIHQQIQSNQSNGHGQIQHNDQDGQKQQQEAKSNQFYQVNWNWIISKLVNYSYEQSAQSYAKKLEQGYLTTTTIDSLINAITTSDTTSTTTNLSNTNTNPISNPRSKSSTKSSSSLSSSKLNQINVTTTLTELDQFLYEYAKLFQIIKQEPIHITPTQIKPNTIQSNSKSIPHPIISQHLSVEESIRIYTSIIYRTLLLFRYETVWDPISNQLVHSTPIDNIQYLCYLLHMGGFSNEVVMNIQHQFNIIPEQYQQSIINERNTTNTSNDRTFSKLPSSIPPNNIHNYAKMDQKSILFTSTILHYFIGTPFISNYQPTSQWLLQYSSENNPTQSQHSVSPVNTLGLINNSIQNQCNTNDSNLNTNSLQSFTTNSPQIAQDISNTPQSSQNISPSQSSQFFSRLIDGYNPYHHNFLDMNSLPPPLDTPTIINHKTPQQINNNLQQCDVINTNEITNSIQISSNIRSVQPPHQQYVQTIPTNMIENDIEICDDQQQSPQLFSTPIQHLTPTTIQSPPLAINDKIVFDNPIHHTAQIAKSTKTLHSHKPSVPIHKPLSSSSSPTTKLISETSSDRKKHHTHSKSIPTKSTHHHIQHTSPFSNSSLGSRGAGLDLNHSKTKSILQSKFSSHLERIDFHSPIYNATLNNHNNKADKYDNINQNNKILHSNNDIIIQHSNKRHRSNSNQHTTNSTSTIISPPPSLRSHSSQSKQSTVKQSHLNKTVTPLQKVSHLNKTVTPLQKVSHSNHQSKQSSPSMNRFSHLKSYSGPHSHIPKPLQLQLFNIHPNNNQKNQLNSVNSPTSTTQHNYDSNHNENSHFYTNTQMNNNNCIDLSSDYDIHMDENNNTLQLHNPSSIFPSKVKSTLQFQPITISPQSPFEHTNTNTNIGTNFQFQSNNYNSFNLPPSHNTVLTSSHHHNSHNFPANDPHFIDNDNNIDFQQYCQNNVNPTHTYIPSPFHPTNSVKRQRNYQDIDYPHNYSNNSNTTTPQNNYNDNHFNDNDSVPNNNNQNDNLIQSTHQTLFNYPFLDNFHNNTDDRY